MDTQQPTNFSPSREERLLSDIYLPHRSTNPPTKKCCFNIWRVFAHFIANFLIQLTELLAPIFLILGAGWALILPFVKLASTNLGSLSDDPQTHDLIAHLSTLLPTRLVIAGFGVTPLGIILIGIFLMMIAAASATASTWLAKKF